MLDLLYNVHWIVPGSAARAAQPYLGGWRRLLQAWGIKSVINLRGAHPYWRWWQDEVSVCRMLGIAHFDVALCSRKVPEADLLACLIDVFDAAPRPVLIKCSGGADRTSFAAALFILHTQGWESLEAATVQFSRFPYLHFPGPKQRWLKTFILLAEEEAGGVPLTEWVRTRYRHADFAAALGSPGDVCPG